MKFPKKTIRDVPIDGKTVLLRADYNVPLHEDGTIADDYRIQQSLPTLRYLLERSCKIVICAHLGRPDGTAVPKYSLAPVAARLEELLGQYVAFVPATVGDRVIQTIKRMPMQKVALLENLRFQPGEEADDEAFARQLARDSQADYFVQDGFGVVHRAHASTSAVTRFLPSVSGLLLEKEYTAITSAMHNPRKPLVAILGGAKVSDKIKVIERLIDVSDHILIGGAMANTFLKYRGYPVGASLHEHDLDGTMRSIYEKAEKKVGADVDEFLQLPSDVAVAGKIEKTERRSVVSVQDVKEDELILDIGSNTIRSFTDKLREASTVVWSGTLGYAELPQFAIGSEAAAATLAERTDATSLIGGGDTVDFILHWDERHGESFSHVSTGGSASLDLMAGEPMPGIDALLNS